MDYSSFNSFCCQYLITSGAAVSQNTQLMELDILPIFALK